ncbi:hypothetical protein OIV83_002094 [Microbotryomycetes sp. JL201]|nr:hypothetical protein OIV83_002094 [Microbotryomycetes sp. JL201]
MFIRGLYFIWPVLGALFWTATLISLLLLWTLRDGADPYDVDQGTIVFISNVGAEHKTLFIAGNACTFAFWSITLITERWLHHLRRIPGSLNRHETNLDIASVVFGCLGGLALLLLAIFDANNYANVHWSMTAVFVVCIAICAILQTTEVMLLERDHPGRKHLRRNAIVKLSIVLVAVAGAIAFIGTYVACASQPNDRAPTARCNRIQSAAAVLEWFIAFLFDAYIITFIQDLWPATKTRGHKFTPELVEKDQQNVLHHHKDGRPGAPITEHRAQPGASMDGYSTPDSLGERVGRPSEDARRL